jgi:DNA-binding NarL/FixJ family response regulator
MQPIKIALVDDHHLFRSGMASLINSFSGYKILLEAGNGQEFIDKISQKFKPDIALLDLNMPVLNGLQTIEWLNKNFPEMNIIVLSMFQDAEKVVNVIRMGVKGYVLKDAHPDEFRKALDTVSASGVYFPDFVTRHLVKNLNSPQNIHQVKLNDREKEFLKLASTELTYKEIANKMFLSARTVDGYRDHLFEKLNIRNRVGLVLYAIKNKIVEI